LWTIPLELICYLVLGAIAVLRITRSAIVFAMLIFVSSAAIPLGVMISGNPVLFGAAHGRALVFEFMAGASLFALRSVTPFHGGLALFGALLAMASLTRPGLLYLACFPIAYVTAWIGLQRLPNAFWAFNGDYSYGLYLFAFPLQQAVWLLSPWKMWWLNFALSLPLGLFFAALSWRWIEKPVLDRKHAIIGRLTLWAASVRLGLASALRS
jgi:peptidoglycan/LPS O-acetylase OafA/YrhL